MDDGTQKDVVRGLRQGSREAWLRLYEAYAARVWGEVARLVGNRPDVIADVVQETFLAAARSARGFDPGRGTLWLWLWGIARKQVARHYRGEARHDGLRRAQAWSGSLNGQKRDWLVGRSDAPPEALASAELATLVRAALLELPVEYQFLLTAKYMDGESVEEIAGDLGSTGSAVRSKLVRARRAFRGRFSRLTRSRSSE